MDFTTNPIRNDITGVQMKPNVNVKTGIPFGVVSLNNLASWVFDEFLNEGTNTSYEEALADFIAAELKSTMDPDEDSFNDEYESDMDTYTLEKEGMKLQISGFGGAYMLWVFESPHIAQASQCSPCVQNAGDLDNQHEGGIDCYTLPAGWFNQEE